MGSRQPWSNHPPSQHLTPGQQGQCRAYFRTVLACRVRDDFRRHRSQPRLEPAGAGPDGARLGPDERRFVVAPHRQGRADAALRLFHAGFSHLAGWRDHHGPYLERGARAAWCDRKSGSHDLFACDRHGEPEGLCGICGGGQEPECRDCTGAQMSPAPCATRMPGLRKAAASLVDVVTAGSGRTRQDRRPFLSRPRSIRAGPPCRCDGRPFPAAPARMAAMSRAIGSRRGLLRTVPCFPPAVTGSQRPCRPRANRTTRISARCSRRRLRRSCRLRHPVAPRRRACPTRPPHRSPEPFRPMDGCDDRFWLGRLLRHRHQPYEYLANPSRSAMPSFIAGCPRSRERLRRGTGRALRHQ